MLAAGFQWVFSDCNGRVVEIEKTYLNRSWHWHLWLILLNFLLVPRFGLIGAAVGTAISLFMDYLLNYGRRAVLEGWPFFIGHANHGQLM